jgi:uncharacterized cupin superfamily protein
MSTEKNTLATVTVVPADVVTGELSPGTPPPGIRFENGASVTDRIVHAGDDGIPTTVLWNSTVGTTVYAEPLAHPERGYVISGKGRFVNADGSEHPVSPGSAFVLPAGWSGRFEVDEPVRKVIFV